MSEEIYLNGKSRAPLLKAIEKHKSQERDKIVDAFMDNAPTIGDDAALNEKLSKIPILRDADGKFFYECPHTGEIKPVPDEVVLPMLQSEQ